MTFLTERVGGTQVSKDQPFAAQGDWLQLLIQVKFTTKNAPIVLTDLPEYFFGPKAITKVV